MRFHFVLPMIAGLSLAACGGSYEFQKRGASHAQVKRDSSECWAYANRQSLSEDEKTARLVAGAVVGGVIGIVATSAANEAANKPKSSYRQGVHDECMRKRGYD